MATLMTHEQCLKSINARWVKTINAILGPEADEKMREAAITRMVAAGVFPARRAVTVAQEMGVAVGA
jgi:hypothetical protein